MNSTNNTLSIGTEIYYTGDMANSEGEGVIVGTGGRNLAIKLDDGRDMVIHPAAFVPGPGRRFMTMVERKAERSAALQKFFASVK